MGKNSQNKKLNSNRHHGTKKPPTAVPRGGETTKLSSSSPVSKSNLPPPSTSKTNKASHRSSSERLIDPHAIKGSDDTGRFYNDYDELLKFQEEHKDEFYRANSLWWADGGYNGSTDDEAMIGDEGGIADGEEGLSFLDRYLSTVQTACTTSSSTSNVGSSSRQSTQPQLQQQQFHFDQAVDLGAGVGRVTKLILLKRYNEVRLVEGDEGWSKRSRVYLGRKRASRCTFSHQRLDTLTRADVASWGNPFVDLMWVQWTFQYMIDSDVIQCLKVLSSSSSTTTTGCSMGSSRSSSGTGNNSSTTSSGMGGGSSSGGLRPGSGILIVKENRPYGTQREDRFQMDIPEGMNQRYDITRSDLHHRWLFQQAGWNVLYSERGTETNTYVLSPSSAVQSDS